MVVSRDVLASALREWREMPLKASADRRNIAAHKLLLAVKSCTWGFSVPTLSCTHFYVEVVRQSSDNDSEQNKQTNKHCAANSLWEGTEGFF